jgi:ParB/RepB/Spo0J family partition protein
MPKKTELLYLKRGDITIGERFRKDYGDLEELADSLKEHGIIQPVSVDSDKVLLAGGRRMAAAKMANLVDIPVQMIYDTDEVSSRELELLENIQRKDMTWQERCSLIAAIDKLHIAKHGENWSGRKTADIVGRSVGGVNRQLQLASAMEHIPQLSKCTTEDEAFRKLKKLEEQVVVAHMRKQQDAAIEAMVDEAENKEGAQNLVNPAVAYASDHYQIGDAFAGLDELYEMRTNGHGIVNLFEVDPPYGIDLADVKKRKEGNTGDLDKYEEVERADYPAFLEKLTDYLYQTAAENAWCIFWFGSEWYSEVFQALTRAGWSVDKIPAVWIKGEADSSGAGQTASPKTYLGRAYEPFFIAQKGKPIIAKEGRTNVFPFKPVAAARKYHPTQRPVELMDEILQTFTFPGQIICSPFLGSGVTLRSAYRNNLNGFGWELNSHMKDQFLLSLDEDK